MYTKGGEHYSPPSILKQAVNRTGVDKTLVFMIQLSSFSCQFNNLLSISETSEYLIKLDSHPKMFIHFWMTIIKSGKFWFEQIFIFFSLTVVMWRTKSMWKMRYGVVDHKVCIYLTKRDSRSCWAHVLFHQFISYNSEVASSLDTRKNVRTCRKSVDKPSTNCVRKFSTSLEQLVISLTGKSDLLQGCLNNSDIPDLG